MDATNAISAACFAKYVYRFMTINTVVIITAPMKADTATMVAQVIFDCFI